MSDWKPGMRHQVTEATGYDDEWGVLHWKCVDCGQWFTHWPADTEECPGPADPEQRGFARGFAQGITFAKARERPVPAADDPRVAGEALGPERGREAP